MGETFEEFRKSFSYGTRSDLTFKFLAALDDDEAAEFLRLLLADLGDLLDSGDPSAVIDRIIGGQADAYLGVGLAERYHYDDAPFTAPSKPVSESRVALLASSGHFVEGDDPAPFGDAGMTQQEAEERISDFLRSAPDLSTLPVDVPAERLVVRHGGYDVRGARIDHNVNLPLEPLQALADEGVIGTLHPDVFSFVGAASQMRMATEIAPAWAELFVELGLDVVLLVPV